MGRGEQEKGIWGEGKIGEEKPTELRYLEVK